MDLVKLCKIGWNLQYLRLAENMKANVKGNHYIIELLEETRDFLIDWNLSTKSQVNIENLITNLSEKYIEGEQIKSEDAKKINENIHLWNDRISNDLAEKKVIQVFSEGTLNPQKLLDGGNSFFPDNVWNTLSDISKSDLNDACNCLLTKSWTPAVMISLRAAEDSIRNYYKTKTKKSNMKIGWKKMLDELSLSKDINLTFLGYLNYIREIRNAAEHPDEIFDQMEAERVFHQVINMIILIDRELIPKKPLNELSVKELRIILKNKKLKTSGNKVVLLERLQKNN